MGKTKKAPGKDWWLEHPGREKQGEKPQGRSEPLPQSHSEKQAWNRDQGLQLAGAVWDISVETVKYSSEP